MAIISLPVVSMGPFGMPMLPGTGPGGGGGGGGGGSNALTDGWTVKSTFSGMSNERFYSIGDDSNNNFYAAGYDAVDDTILVASYDKDGNYRWSYNAGGTSDRLYDTAVDTNGNMVAVGYSMSTTSGSTPYPALIVKYTSAGSLVWSRALNDSSSHNWLALAVTTDSSDNIYIAGRTQAQSNGNNDLPFVAKLNNAGAVQWVKKYDHGGQQSQPEGIALDSNGDIIVSGRIHEQITGGGYSAGMVFKASGTDGSIIWNKFFDDGEPVNGYHNDQFQNVAITPEDDILTCGWTNKDYAGTYYGAVIKLSGTDGSIVWQRHTNETDGTKKIAVDSAGKIYTFTDSEVLFVYASDGTLEQEWKITASGSGADAYYIEDVYIDKNDNAVLCGFFYTGGGDPAYPFITKLPATIQAGTTGDFVITAQSKGDSAGGLTPTTFTNYTANTMSGVITNGTSGLTPSSVSATSTGPNTVTGVSGGGGGGGQPVYGYGSAFFDGLNDYIETPSSLDFTMGTGDFTVECWFKPGFDTSVDNTYHAYLWEIGNQRVYITIDDGTLYLANFAIGAIANVSIGNIQGEWHHVAVTKESNVYTLWYDGQSQGSATDSNEITGPTGNESLIFRIANHTYNTTGTYYYTGHVSNMRVIKGTALYTSNFTVPTTPLSKVTNTVLLTCQDTTGTITDNSDSNHTLNIIGDTVATTNSPFVHPNYTQRGSTYFDGGEDYLKFPNSGTSNDLIIGTNDFTLEFWIYAKSFTNGGVIYDTRSGHASSLMVNFNTSGNLRVYANSGYRITADGVPLENWQHYAIVRDSGTTRLFLNGVQDTETYSDTNNYTGDTVFIGRHQSGVNVADFDGYISNLRLVTGTALYPPANGGSAYFDGTNDLLKISNNTSFRLGTGNFTIECWVYFTDTSLEGGSNRRIFNLHETGNAVDNLQIVIDNGGYRKAGDLFLYSNSIQGYLDTDIRSGWHHIAVVRDSGTLKFYLDGVSKYSASNTQDYSPGGGSGPRPTIGSRGDDKGDYNGYISNFRMVVGTAVYTDNFTVPTAPLTDISNTQLLTCQNTTGSITDASSNSHVVNITGGVSASYSSPFVESKTALTDITNTKLLTAQNSSGAITDESSIGHSVHVNSNAQASSLHPFKATGSTDGSYYFSSLNAWNGTNARVITADSNDFNLPDGTDVTIEFWYKIPVTPPTAGNGYLFDLGDGNYGWLAAYAWNQNGTHTLRVGTYFGAIWLADEDLVGMRLNQWYHLAITRESGVWKVYLDGVFQGSKVSSTLGSFDTYPDRISLGGYHNMSYPNYGVISYISDFRFVKGLAVYTGNFTPPSGPLTTTGGTYPSTANITNPTSAQTLLLTAQNSSGSFVDNSQYSRSLTSYNTVTTEAGVPN